MTMIKHFLLILFINSTLTTPPFQITDIGNSGIFFERTHEITWFVNMSTITTSIDIPDLRDQIQTLHSCKNSLEVLCEGISALHQTDNCKTIIHKLKLETSDIERNEFIIHHIPKRSRRGLINGVGTVSKFLFGTMDSEDDKYINSQLDELNRQQERTGKVLRDQVATMTSNFKALSEPLSQLDKNLKTTENRVETLTTNWNEMIKYNQKNNKLNNLNQEFTEISEILIITCNRMSRIQHDYLAIIDDLQDNRIHPLLFTYKDLSSLIKLTTSNEMNNAILTPSTLHNLANVEHIELEKKS